MIHFQEGLFGWPATFILRAMKSVVIYVKICLLVRSFVLCYHKVEKRRSEKEMRF